MPQRFTIVELAKHAGVSRSTASRAINNDPNVNAETRQRVLEIADKLNYHPNVAARSLAAGRSRILGRVIPVAVSALFSDPYFPILIQGISAACNANDHSVMLWLAEPEQERRMIQQIMHDALIDGVIIASMLMDDILVKSLLERGLPFVLVGRHPTDARVNYVDVDNQDGAREIVTYLLRLGYARVATIPGPHNMIAGADRLEGYKAALRARGITPDPALMVEGDFSEGGGYAAMQRLLAHAPDAVFVASDAMALGALRALREVGKRVPDDIALASFDDMPFAAHTEPPLTTVRQPIHRMGAIAAETLIDVIEHRDSPPRRIILPTEMVIRASSGSGPRATT